MSRARVTQIAQIGSEPVTLAEAKAHMKIDVNDENDLIASLIVAARIQAEQITRRTIVKKTLKASFDGSFGGELPWWDGTREGALVEFQSSFLELPYPPAISVQEVGLFDDSDVKTVALPSTYIVDTSSQDLPGRLVLRRGCVWPVALRVINGMEVNYTAGYEDGSVPSALKTAVMMLATALYQTRGDMADANATSAKSGAAPLLAMFTIERVTA